MEKIDEYGLEIPPENLPLSKSFYVLTREILEGQKIANGKVYYYKLKADLYLLGIKENLFYDGEKTSSVAKYIYEPN